MPELECIPKHQMIADHFRRQILSGEIGAGERLSPDSEIARHFKVNKRTAAKGMSQLVADGLISRAPGRGSVVVRGKTVERRSNMVGVVSFNSDHLHDDIAAELTEGILKHGLYPVWISQSIFREAVGTPNYPPLTGMLERLIEDCPHGMIVDGERFLPFDLLRRNLAKIHHLVFIMNYMRKERMPAKYILVDYEEGAKRIAAYLFRKGHRKIACLGRSQALVDGYEPTVQMINFREINATFRELGGEAVESPFYRLMGGESPEQVLREELPGSGITALVMPFDHYWIHEVSPVVAGLGLKVPDDLSVVGYYNTPWCEQSTPRLTSVAVGQQRIARMAVEMLFDEISETEVKIVPEIVERDSVREL